MKLFADENVELGIVNALRKERHVVRYVAENSSGIDDEQVLRRASEESAVLVTSDKDFGDLVYRQGRAAGGVLLLRISSATAAKRVDLVIHAVRQYGPELVGAFSVLTPRALRIRRRQGQ